MNSYENFPQELRELDQWICWRHEHGTKIPKVAGTLRNAKSNDPGTWGSFGRCVAAEFGYPGRYAGVGFVFTKDDAYVGVDLDDVRDPQMGNLTPRATEILSRLDSYAEVSPSSEGVKLWVRADLNRAWKKPGVEIYPHARWFAVTGRLLSGFTPTVESRQEELAALIEDEFPKPAEEPRRPYEGPAGKPTDLLELLISGEIVILRHLSDGTAEQVYAIVCPWWREHTRGDTSGTRVGQYANGALWFRCEHAHCAHRGWTDLRALVKPRVEVRIGKSKARRVSRRTGRSVA